MPGDMFVAFPARAKKDAVLEDMFARARASCENSDQGVCSDEALGGTNDLVLVDAAMLAGKQVFKFKRKLVTGDEWDLPIKDDNAGHVKSKLIYAVGDGNPDMMQGHRNDHMGSISVDLFEGSAARQLNVRLMFRAHGIIMGVSWAVLIPMAIFFSRFMRAHTWWFRAHTLCATLGAAGSVVGIAIAILAVQSTGGTHFQLRSNPHQFIGGLLLLGGLLQPVLGVIADYKWDPARKAAPWWPDRVHWYFGRLLFTAAFVNITLGIALIAPSTSVIVAVWLWLGFVFSFGLGMDVGVRKSAIDSRLELLRAQIRVIYDAEDDIGLLGDPGGPPELNW